MQSRPQTASSCNTHLTFLSATMTALLEDQNQCAVKDNFDSGRRHYKPQGIKLLTRSPEPRVPTSPSTGPLTPINTEYSGRIPQQTQIIRLRRENASLVNQIQTLERQQSINREVLERERLARCAYQSKIQELQAQLSRKNHKTEGISDQHLKTYEKYIDNLQKAKEDLEQEVRRLRKDNQKIQKLQSSLRNLQRENSRLEDTILHKQNEMNSTIAQITMETERKKGPVYIEQLEKANTFLQKQLKRMNGILLERMKVAKSMY